MMFNFKGGGRVKSDPKKPDIIYEYSLILQTKEKCRSWEVLQQKNMVQHIMFVKLFFLQLESWVSNNENDDSKKR